MIYKLFFININNLNVIYYFEYNKNSQLVRANLKFVQNFNISFVQ